MSNILLGIMIFVFVLSMGVMIIKTYNLILLLPDMWYGHQEKMLKIKKLKAEAEYLEQKAINEQLYSDISSSKDYQKDKN